MDDKNKNLNQWENDNVIKIKFNKAKWINTFAQAVINRAEETGKNVIGIMNNVEVLVKPEQWETVTTFIDHYRELYKQEHINSRKAA